MNPNRHRRSFTRADTEDNQYLLRLFEELMPNTQFYTEPRAYNRTRYPSETNETTLFMRYLRETMMEYNLNIHQYQENMRQFLDTMDSLERHMFTSRTNQNRSRTTDVPPLFVPSSSNTRQPRPRSNIWENIDPLLIRRMRPNYQDVAVRPTNEQILNATEQFVFNSADAPITNEEDNTRPRCPITLDNFNNGEIVTRIRSCGHTFQSAAIINWFNSNVRCPVCRYDIREWTNGTEATGANEATHTNDTHPNDTGANEATNANETRANESEAWVTRADLSGNENTRSPIINSLINEITTGLNNAIHTYMNTDYDSDSYPDAAIYTFTIGRGT
jgi:hypothetical protein